MQAGPCGKPWVVCQARRAMRRLLAHYMLPQWPRVALLGLLSFSGTGLDVLNPQVMRRFVDGAVAGDAMPVLLGLGGIYLAIAVSSELLWIGESHLAQLAAWTATNELRAEATAHLIRLDLRYSIGTLPVRSSTASTAT